MTSVVLVSSLFAQLGAFVAERRGRKEHDSRLQIDDFRAWLSNNKLNAIRSQVDQTAGVADAIEALFRKQNEEILEILSGIDSTLSTIVSRHPLLSPLGAVTDIPLSAQARSALIQFDQSDAEFLIDASHTNGDRWCFYNRNMSELAFDEPRFLRDDFQSLCELGLIAYDPTDGGTERYRITRTGSEVAKALAAKD